MSDANDPQGSKPATASTQNDKLYTAEGILDPRKRKAEKKRRKASRPSALNDMDADYDFKVDYRMEDGGSEGAHADDEDGGDGSEDNEPMTGVDDA